MNQMSSLHTDNFSEDRCFVSFGKPSQSIYGMLAAFHRLIGSCQFGESRQICRLHHSDVWVRCYRIRSPRLWLLRIDEDDSLTFYM